MKRSGAELTSQYQLPTVADPRMAVRKRPAAGDVTLAWITNAEVYSAVVQVTEVADSRIGLWCPDLVPTGHTVLVASNDGTGAWGVVSRCIAVPSGYRVDVELNLH